MAFSADEPWSQEKLTNMVVFYLPAAVGVEVGEWDAVGKTGGPSWASQLMGAHDIIFLERQNKIPVK